MEGTLVCLFGQGAPNKTGRQCFMMSVAVRFVWFASTGETRRSAWFLPPMCRNLQHLPAACIVCTITPYVPRPVTLMNSVVPRLSRRVQSSRIKSSQIKVALKRRIKWLELLGILGLRSRVGRPSPETQWQALSKRRGVSRLLIGRAKLQVRRAG